MRVLPIKKTPIRQTRFTDRQKQQIWQTRFADRVSEAFYRPSWQGILPTEKIHKHYFL